METREIVSGTPAEDAPDSFVATTSEHVIEEHTDHRLIEVTQMVQPGRYEVSGDAGGSWGGGYYPSGDPTPNIYVVKELKL